MIPSVKYDKALRLEEGLFVHNPKELLEQLKLMKDEEFIKYQEKNPEAIINWFKENYKTEELSRKLGKKSTRKEYIFHLQNFIRINETEEEIKKSISADKKIMIQYSLMAIILILVGLQFTAYIKNQEGATTQTFIATISGQAIEIQKLGEENALLNEENEELKNRILELEDYRSLIKQEYQITGPADRIKITDLAINSTHVLFKVNNALAAEFTNTGSMLPTISNTATALQIKPENETEIRKGDIISYKYQDTIIVHRVVETGNDENGWYAYTKGDNNPVQDKEKVRFSEIERILVAIIY